MLGNRNLTLFTEITKVDDIREMSEMEIAGAITFVYDITSNFELSNYGESQLAFNQVYDYSFYCRQQLSLNNNYGYTIKQELDKQLILDSVFMREFTNNSLWGWAYWYDTETEESTNDMFLVRIS